MTKTIDDRGRGQGQLPSHYHCPYCKKRLDGFTGMNDGASEPEPGSLSICMYCAKLMQFTADGLARLSAAEFDQLDPETRSLLTRGQQACRLAAAQGRAKTKMPLGYYRDAEVMYQAAARWMREHPCATVTFHQLDREIMYIGALDDTGIAVLACNDGARDLLKAMDLASGHRGTIFQAQMVLEFLLAPPGGAES